LHYFMPKDIEYLFMYLLAISIIQP
jgi:hypothetical protein